MIRQGVTYYTHALSLALKKLPITMISLLIMAISSSSFAKSELSYGPIQRGQTLWEIAKETLPNDSISVEQLVYAFYKLNPDAFQSGNMNLLQAGAYITIPDTNVILKTSSKDAKKQLSQHLHALDVLRVDAKQLKKSKSYRNKYKRQIRRLQKELGKYRHRSRAWNNTYRKLVKSKRNYAKSKRKVAKLHKLLLEKATLTFSKPIKKENNDDIRSVKNQLTQIQTSLVDLQQSNNVLVEKAENLVIMNQRIGVLEEELGKTDEVVIQLKSTLITAQEAIQDQNHKTEALQQDFQVFKNTTKQSPENSSDLIRSPDANLDDKKTVDEEIVSSQALKIELTPSEQKEFSYLSEENLIDENPQNFIHAISTETEFNQAEIRAISFAQIERTTVKRINYLRKHEARDQSHWKIITIGGILNGIILIFVLFKLLYRRQTDTTS